MAEMGEPTKHDTRRGIGLVAAIVLLTIMAVVIWLVVNNDDAS